MKRMMLLAVAVLGMCFLSPATGAEQVVRVTQGFTVVRGEMPQTISSDHPVVSRKPLQIDGKWYTPDSSGVYSECKECNQTNQTSATAVVASSPCQNGQCSTCPSASNCYTGQCLSGCSQPQQAQGVTYAAPRSGGCSLFGGSSGCGLFGGRRLFSGGCSLFSRGSSFAGAAFGGCR